MQLIGYSSYNLRQGQENGKRIRNYTYHYSDLIGIGNFSKVYKGVNTNTKEVVAIKIVSLDEMKSQHLEQMVFEEINILQQLNHPHILKFHEALLSERNCYIITQLCDGGNLEDRIATNIPFSEEELSTIISDVFQGLKYLREMRVCHRDIKSANIFLSGGRAKIADFGLAKFYKDLFKDLDIGSPPYMSPEGLIHNVYGEKTDMWAYGIVIYEILHGKTPFIDCQTEIDIKTAVSRPIPEYKFNPNIPPCLRRLLNSLLTIQEQKRPSVYDIQFDPYIKASLTQGNGTRKQNISTGLNVIQTSKTNKNNSKNSPESTNESLEGRKKEGSQKPIQLGGSRSNAKKKSTQGYQGNYAHLQATNLQERQPVTHIYSVNPFQTSIDQKGKRVNTIETSDSQKAFFRRNEARFNHAFIK